MSSKVIAIGLDSADPLVIENWISEGYLKNLAKLIQEGAYGRLSNVVSYGASETPAKITERVWGMFLSGCSPQKTGYWGPIQYDRDNYTIAHDYTSGAGAYDFQEYPLFYALGENYKVATFDVPGATLSPLVNGVQVLGWGGHAPCTPSISQPPEVFQEILKKYGKNPILNSDHGFWWDENYFSWIEKILREGCQKRAEIAKDLLQQDSWDLFLTVFAESHTAGHDFWQYSHSDSPFYARARQNKSKDYMLETFEQIDRAIGEILSVADESTYVVTFSLHGMGNNITDLSSMMFLPELMYRFNFPGKYGFAYSKSNKPPAPSVHQPRRRSWPGEIWQLRHDSNLFKRWLRKWVPSKFDKFLTPDLSADSLSPASPYQMLEQKSPLFWMPAMWYRHLWPRMKAFALPSVGSGHIRINLQGREPQGQVSLEDYDQVCEEVTAFLHRIVDARTKKPLVKEVVRTRSSASDSDPKQTDADLVVIYHEDPESEECMTDVIDSPDVGRIGPVTYSRFGGHRPRGFVSIKGPSIPAQTTLKDGLSVDLAPTILHLMGAPISSYLDGQSLLEVNGLSLAKSVNTIVGV